MSLIKYLKNGLKLQCPQQCIDGMMLCVLEMQDTMVKMLPSIILELSKMSATPSMAVPVLEFLSSEYELSFRGCNRLGYKRNVKNLCRGTIPTRHVGSALTLSVSFLEGQTLKMVLNNAL